MWIHVPCRSVADMGESNWDLKQSSQELKSSATWRTKSLKAASWERVLGTESLTMLLSGLTLEPSMRNLGVERWISSLEDSRANHTPLPEESEEPTTQENSQEMYSVLRTNLGDQLSFLKMSPTLSDSIGTKSDLSYEQWDTELKRSSLQREKQAHRISDSDYSSWPTADTQNSRDGSVLRKSAYGSHSVSLHHKVAYWRTVSAQEEEGGVKDFNKKVGLGGQVAQHKLRDQVAHWATTTTNPATYSGANYGPNLIEQSKMFSTPTTQESVHEEMELTETNRRKTKDGTDSHSLNLQDQVRVMNWPTTAQRDYKGGSIGTLKERNGSMTRVSNTTGVSHGMTLDTAILIFPSTLQDQKITADGHTCSPKCRRLNPRFAEWLMGLPRGWVSSSAQLETESFQPWLQKLGFYVLEDLNE